MTPDTGPTSAGGKPERLRARAEDAAAGLPALMLAAERLSAALSAGSHGLRRAGSGEEFWQYRPAAPGDSLRSIDWRRSARSDAQFVRDRELQTAQAAVVWVSDGQGMGYSGAANRVSKGDRADLLALAIAISLLRGGERVGLAGQPPRAGRAQIDRIAQGLVLHPDAAGGDDDAPPIHALRPGQRVLLIADFLGDPAPVLSYLERAAGMGVRGALLQVLDPDEETFPFSGAVLFRTPGGTARHDTRDAQGLRAAYLNRLAERRELLRQAAARSGWHFGTHDTANAPAQALLWIASVLEG